MIVVVRQAKLWPDVDLSVLGRTLDALGDRLTALDRAFVHALYDTVVRRWNTLEFLVQCELRQAIGDIEPRLRAVLLTGAAQVVFMDRVPAHSAINHAVEWGKQVIRPGAGSLVNAVLRKLARLVPTEREAARRERFTGLADELALDDGSAVALAGLSLPDDPIRRLAIGASCPEALLDHWLKRCPMPEVRRLALHGLTRAPIVLNTAHASAAVPEQLAPHQTPGHHVWNGPPSELSGFLSGRSDIWVQDAGSSAAIESLRGLAPRVIADLCAGQGTKTRQLAAVFPEAEIFATDIDPHRLDVLGRVFAGSERVRVRSLESIRERLLGAADLVVLDVPCSNTGVLARRPEARHRFDGEHLRSLTNVQRQLIADSIPLLSAKPRGVVVYSTCSVEVEENADQAAWASRWHSLARSRELVGRPSGGPGATAESYRDGAYSVVLGA